MKKLTALCASLTLSALPLAVAAGPAHAGPTESAPLVCGSITYTITGFGRGQVFFVEGTKERFVVTSAQRAGSGETLFDAPGQAGKDDIVSCTTTAPPREAGTPGTTFLFRGFFTPRA